jgi:hypothetical protein
MRIRIQGFVKNAYSDKDTDPEADPDPRLIRIQGLVLKVKKQPKLSSIHSYIFTNIKETILFSKK